MSFGGTVKLTGESEYRKALNEISSNLKVLNSEMKSVTSQYDKNDKSVENLSSQNEVLNKKIEEQEKKVGILKDALKMAKSETGENSEQTKKWQTELNNAQAELNKLNRDVESNKEAMKEAANKTGDGAKAVKEFGEEADKSGKSALSMGDIIKANLISEAIIGGLKSLASGIASIGNSMKDALTEGAAYADTILTLSVQTGLSTDTLEKYNAVAELTDVSMETLTKSMAKNIKSMSEARDGSKSYAEAYEKLGIKVTDSNGSLRDGETVYWETIDALKGIENETERDALAMELFGKSAQELNTIIEMGSGGVKEYTDKAESMGAVLGGEGLQALGNLDDQMQTFAGTMASTKNILASAFAPAMASAMGSVNNLAGSFNQLIAAVVSGDEGGIEGAMTMVSEQVTAMVENVSTILPQMVEVASTLFTTLFEVIAQNLPLIVNEGAKMLSSLLSGIANNIGTVMNTIMSVIQTLLNTIVANLPTIVQMGCDMLVSLIQGIASMIPQLIPTIMEALLLMVETLLDNIDAIIDAGIELILGLAEGLITAIPMLIEKIPEIITKLINAIVENLPKIIAMGGEILVQLAVGLVKAIPQLVAKLPEIIVAIVKGLGEGLADIAAVGKAIVEGLWEGIKGLASWLWDKVSQWCSDLWNGILDFFGIASPSKKMKWVGEMMVDGMAGSIEENGDKAVESAEQMSADVMSAFEGINTDGIMSAMTDVQSSIPHSIDTNINANVNSISGATATSQYDTMVNAFKQALTEVKVVMDDREMGTFITNTIERVVFA